MASPPERKSLTAYDLMDGMRALAAMTVVISHERNILFLDATTGMSAPWKIFYFATGFGHQAVMIFFVLSGYWIGNGFPWSDYGIDRLSRLWVVLVPALFLGGILDSIGRYGTEAPIYLGIQGTNTLTYDVATHLTLRDLAGSFVFVQSLLVHPFGSNGPLWSLANEFWYYVWFPPLYQLLSKRGLSIAAGLFALITMSAFRQLLPGFICWLFGSLLFYCTQRPIVRTAPERRARFAVAATSLLFFGVLGLSRLPQLAIDGNIQDILISGCFALLLFAVIRSANSYPHQLAPLCRYGARSSYSLYVVHFPLVVFLAALFVAPAHRLPPSTGLLLSFIGIGLVAIFCGYVVSAVTEGNTSTLRRWLKRQYFSERTTKNNG
jgi:peptidoglycan/LPS O-acetylase OafA/YrhL